MVNSFNWLFLPVFNVDGYRFTQEVSNTGKIINIAIHAHTMLFFVGEGRFPASSFSLRFVHRSLPVWVKKLKRLLIVLNSYRTSVEFGVKRNFNW